MIAMRILSMTWLFVLALPLAAHAQETGTGATTGSGAMMVPTSEILQNILNIAPTRVARTAKQLLVSEKIQTAWVKESTLTRTRMNDQRTECNDLVRRSNRDQRMGKILQCQRAMLMLESGLLRNQTQYLNAIPLVDAKLKATATGAIARLENAMMAIVDGIDTGLFTSEGQLISARDNLRTVYREPVWKAMIPLHADRELTNLLYISKLIKERADVDSSSPIRELAFCLEGTAGMLRSNFAALDRRGASMELAAARAQATVCRGLLHAVAKADRQAATSGTNP